MDILNTLSDDQLAILGCVAAFFLFGGLMSLSYYVGGAGRSSSSAGRNARRFAQTDSVELARVKNESAPRDERKAA